MEKRTKAEDECHVFHYGSRAAYDKFLAANRERITHTELANDRVLVWCKPNPPSEENGIIFIAGYFA